MVRDIATVYAAKTYVPLTVHEDETTRIDTEGLVGNDSCTIGVDPYRDKCTVQAKLEHTSLDVGRRVVRVERGLGRTMSDFICACKVGVADKSVC